MALVPIFCLSSLTLSLDSLWITASDAFPTAAVYVPTQPRQGGPATDPRAKLGRKPLMRQGNRNPKHGLLLNKHSRPHSPSRRRRTCSHIRHRTIRWRRTIPSKGTPSRQKVTHSGAAGTSSNSRSAPGSTPGLDSDEVASTGAECDAATTSCSSRRRSLLLKRTRSRYRKSGSRWRAHLLCSTRLQRIRTRMCRRGHSTTFRVGRILLGLCPLYLSLASRMRALHPPQLRSREQKDNSSSSSKAMPFPGTSSSGLPARIVTQGLQRQNSLPNLYGPSSTTSETVGPASANPGGPDIGGRSPLGATGPTTVLGQFAQMRVGEPGVGA